jgi:hypothetical protein
VNRKFVGVGCKVGKCVGSMDGASYSVSVAVCRIGVSTLRDGGVEQSQLRVEFDLIGLPPLELMH